MIRRRVSPGRLSAGGLAILVLLICAGCAATSTAGGGRDSATGGLRMSLFAQRGTGSHALYKVQPDGTIGYGGGFKARDGKVTWTGQMTVEEIAELRALIDQHGWFEREPISPGEPADYVYRIDLAGPQGKQRYKVVGDSPDVMPVFELLDRIARRRFEDFLQTLPKPSSER